MSTGVDAPSGRDLPAYPLSGTLARVARHAPAELISADAWARATASVGIMPAALTTWMYFECRMHERDARVDMILEIDDVGRAIIAGENERYTLPAPVREHPVWRRIAHFCRTFGPSGALRDVVDHIWLEFDVPADDADRTPVPGIFICFGEVPRDVGGASRAWTRARHAVETLLARPLADAVAARLAACFGALPATGYVPYLGVFFGRDEDLVRFCAIGVSPDELPRFLRDVEWEGSLASLEPYARTLVHQRAFASAPVLGMLHLDVGERCTPRLGVEHQLHRASQFTGMPDDAELLRRLARDGMCAPERVEALWRWPGCVAECLPHEMWRSRVVRWVNHIKLVVESSGAVQVKAYPCAFHNFAPSSRPPGRLWRPRRVTPAVGSVG